MARYPSTVMVSVVCPWDDDEQLDEAVFRREIQHAVTAGFRRIYVFGTAGEGYAVDSARFRRVIEVFGDELAGTDATPMVGVIGLSTANVLERVAVAHAMGFREFQVSLPAWSVLSDDEVVTYLTAVCGAYPDSRFMHYNTARVGRIVDGALYRRLVELIPNLVATKTMTADAGVVAGVVREAPELMHFLTEGTIATGSLHGEVALLGTFGGLAPKKSWAIVDAANNGRHREAAEIGAWFARLQRRRVRAADGRPPRRRRLRQADRAIEPRSRGLPAADAVAVPDDLGRGGGAGGAAPPRELPGLRVAATGRRRSAPRSPRRRSRPRRR